MDMRHGLMVVCSLAALVGCGGAGDEASSGGGGGGPGSGTMGATGESLYVLVGGTTKPTGADIFLDSTTTRGSNVSTLDAGEIFILPKNALKISTNYDVHIEASTGFSGESYTLDFTFTTGGLDPTDPGGTALDRINALRAQAGLSAVASHGNFATAAIKHSGYQCQRESPSLLNSITHGETAGVSFYVDDNFANRISIANGGGATEGTWNWGGSNQVYEDIDSVGGTLAIDRLWNSVYHRMPMMRAQVYRIGNGDRSNAVGHANNTSPIITGSGNHDYHTIEFGGNGAISTTGVTYWPSDGLTGVPARFQTDFEGPDPVSASNGNGTPTDNEVGTPIHVIFPFTNNFTSLIITVAEAP